MAIKTITVQAATFDGVMIFDRTVKGKKHKNALLREALIAIDSIGGVIRYQTHGAKSWLVLHNVKDSGQAVQTREITWPVVS